MAKETKVSFPTIPVAHFLTLRGQLKKSIPTSISTNYLASILNMTEAAASTNIVPGLKLIKLIDNDNKVNVELAKKFRDDQHYKEFCDTVLNNSYPRELLETFPELPDDKGQIKRWFMNHSGVGDNAAGKFASLFTLLLEANPSKTSDIKPSSTNGVKTKPKETKTKILKSEPVAPAQINHSLNDQTAVTPPVVNPANPEVHVNVQVHIAADATNEQIEKIFESMGKHLFNRNK